MSNQKLLTYYRVNYSFTTNTGAFRSSTKILKASSPDEARAITIQALKDKHNFFKINKIAKIESDNPQMDL